MTPKTLLVFPGGLNNTGCSWPLLHPPAHIRRATMKRDSAQKSGERLYWIKPLLTVLEYDGKNLGTEGGLCQQAVFA